MPDLASEIGKLAAGIINDARLVAKKAQDGDANNSAAFFLAMDLFYNADELYARMLGAEFDRVSLADWPTQVNELASVIANCMSEIKMQANAGDAKLAKSHAETAKLSMNALLEILTAKLAQDNKAGGKTEAAD